VVRPQFAGEPVDIDRLEASQSNIVVSAQGSGDDTTIAVNVEAQATPGTYTGQVLAFLKGAHEPSTLRLHWRVRDEIEISPRAVLLGIGSAGQPFSKVMTVVSALADELVIDDVAVNAPPEFVQVSLSRINARCCQLTPTGCLPAEIGAHKYNLTITCSSPAAREIQVPLSALVRAP